MIERKNIISLLGDRTNVYHSALLTSYNFDPIFFESVYLSTLRKLGVTNIVVLIESTMYDQLLLDSNYQYHRVTQNSYTLVRQENSHSGVFHPKMTLLFGEEEGVVIVGSGNLTYSGLSNNEEVWNVFHVFGSESKHYPLFHKAWEYLTDIAQNDSPLILRQIEWMSEHSPWFYGESTEASVTLTSGEDCTFLYNSQESTILNSLYSHVGGKPVNTITIVAPFYDAEGNALKAMKKLFSPKNMICVLDLARQSAPYALLRDNSNIIFNKILTSSPLHAKLVEIQGENETWLLCGSANAGKMALGTSLSVFNDEACILLHNPVNRNYLKDLGLCFTALTSEEKESIIQPIQDNIVKSPLLVILVSCEEKDNKLYLRFQKNGIKGTLTVLDNSQQDVYSEMIVTDTEVIIELGDVDISRFDIVVLKNGGVEISNRVLIVREIFVERGNPDPKCRKLSNFLDDTGMLDNLNHILGCIEFEDVDKKTGGVKGRQKADAETEEDDISVSRDSFNNLKDSPLHINMHSGVRILSYLQQILFKNDDNIQSDEELLNQDEGSINGKDDDNQNGGRSTKSTMADEASKMERDVVNFLKKMYLFLIEKTRDNSIYGDTNPAVNRPKLTAVPGLNAASSFAVASNAVLYLMNRYGCYVSKQNSIRDLLLKNAGVFLSMYANRYPEGDTLRNRKIREILKDATVALLSALSFFEYNKADAVLPQLVLNCLDPWAGQSELEEIMSLYEGQLEKLDINHFNERTSKKINKIAAAYLNGIPIAPLSTHYDSILLYRNGYGFLIVDNIKSTGKGFSYDYHSPWFDDKLDNTTESKFKGFANPYFCNK